MDYFLCKKDGFGPAPYFQFYKKNELYFVTTLYVQDSQVVFKLWENNPTFEHIKLIKIDSYNVFRIGKFSVDEFNRDFYIGKHLLIEKNCVAKLMYLRPSFINFI